MGRGVKKLIGRWQKFKKGRLGAMTNGKIRWSRERGKLTWIGRAGLNRKILDRGRNRSMRWVKWGRGRGGGGVIIAKITFEELYLSGV